MMPVTNSSSVIVPSLLASRALNISLARLTGSNLLQSLEITPMQLKSPDGYDVDN